MRDQETSTTGFWFHASMLAVVWKADEAERRQRNEEESCSRDLHGDSKGKSTALRRCQSCKHCCGHSP